MSQTKLEPALTPEEWAARKVGDSYRGDAVYESDDGWVWVTQTADYRHYAIAHRHAAAALCLHGQPFGFTREDMETLHQAMRYAAVVYDPTMGEHPERLRSLADRIEALLPPED